MNLFAYVPGTKAWTARRNAELCGQTWERLQEIVDGEIGGRRAEQILTKHLEACKSCHSEAAVIVELKAAIARVSKQADEGCVLKLEALAKRLCEEGPPPETPE